MAMKKEFEEEVCRFAEETLGVGVTLTEGSIQFEDVECIACVVDNSLNLAASGSVAISLLSAGGESLQNECRERFPSGIKYGDVIVLGGGNLKCKKVFLTSLADSEFEDEEDEDNFEKSKMLQSTLSTILDYAIREKVKSIAIPAIGIGKIGLSAETVASLYFDCVKEKKTAFGALKNIRFTLFCNSVFKEFERQLLFTMRDGKGKTILHTACHDGKKGMCQYMVNNYAFLVNIRDNNEVHVIHETAWSGSVDWLQRITDIVIPDKDKQHREQYMLKCLTNLGETILHASCYHGKTEMCQYIADNYPSLVNITDNDGRHILHDTAWSGSVDCLQRITDIVIPDKDKQHRERYMLKCLNNDGKTILHMACQNGKTEMCQYIADNYPSLVNITDNDGWHILHDTAWSGSVDCLQRITDIVIPDKDKQHRERYMLKCLTNLGKTILHLACQNGKTEMCQYIVDNYPSLLNIKDNDGYHILHDTAWSGSVDCLQRITDIVIPDKDKQHRERYMLKCLTNLGKTILHMACQNGKTEMCQYIADNYPSLVNIKDNNGYHILHDTAWSGSVDCLQRITDMVIPDRDKQHREKYMLKCLTNLGKTILHIACQNGKTEMCQYIVDNYPRLVNIKDNDGFHILHDTTWSDSVDCLQQVTDIVVPDKDKQHRERYMLKCLTKLRRTILHMACRNGKTEMCQYIADNYPSLVNIKDNNGYHILHDTAWSGSVDCLQRITDMVIPDRDKQHREKYMLKCLTNLGKTILHMACQNGKTEMCQYIADNYPSLVNIKDNNGYHILHDTAWSGSVDCLQRITDMVIPDRDKQHREKYMLKCLTKLRRTILHMACRNGKTEMCQYIVDNYPRLVNIKDNDGFHILHDTAWSGSVDCLQRITDIVIPDKDKQHRERYMLKCLNNDGKTILHMACQNGKTEMCQYIADNYPSLVNITDNDGWHILHDTAWSGSVDCLQRITDIVIPDKDKQHRERYMLKCLTNLGKTILHLACQNGKTEMCQYIVDNYPSLLNIKDNDGYHILHDTAWSGSVDCLQRITDIVIPDKDKQHRERYMLKCLTNLGKTILHMACQNGKTEMCQYIADNYPSLVNIKDNNGYHILHDTAWSGSVDCLQRITDMVIPDRDKQHREKYMLKCLTNLGKTILHIACQNGKTEMCQYIVDNYPRLVNIKDNDGFHILHDTTWSDSVDCLQQVTDIVVPDKDKQHRERYMLKCLNNDGKTILHMACQNGKTEICQYIADNYPSLVNIKDNNGYHILHDTAWSGSVDCLQRITDMVIPDRDKQHREKYMLKCLTKLRRTILHMACRNGKTEMCQYIVDNYPRLVNIKDNDGFHILHDTAWSGSVDCLQQVTDIVVPDKDKQHRERYMLKCLTKLRRTILHIACSSGKIEMCQHIVDNYPSLVNIKDKVGVHILHCTAWSGSVDCLQRITDIVIPDKDKQQREQYMLNCLNNDGSTILHIACQHGKTEMCQYIADNYPSLVNIKDKYGYHILHDTAWSGSVDCLQRITDIVLPDKDKQHREQYMLKCLTIDGSTILGIAMDYNQKAMHQYIADTYPNMIRRKNVCILS